jgi:2-oxoglutarate dehydrogenase E1 component
MTPKSLLRHFVSASTPNELATGRWRRVLDDTRALETADTIRRLILCSGKVYADLLPMQQAIEDKLQIALIRVEQLYPFPGEQLQKVLAGYPNAEEVVWVQEEPANMGAWTYIRPALEGILGDVPLRYIGRPARSSPAEGSTTWHKRNQQAITEHAFKFD